MAPRGGADRARKSKWHKTDRRAHRSSSGMAKISHS